MRLNFAREERGASAVLVAVLLVPLIAFGAIAIDVGNVYAERRQLQNGADAAALAIARDCSNSNCTAAQEAAMKSKWADSLANLNANDGTSTVNSVVIGTNRVTVEVQSRTASGASAISNILAPIFGIDTTVVRARATAVWGPPSSGSLFPMAMSKCEFVANFGGTPVDNMLLSNTALTVVENNSRAVNCRGSNISGGYGWIDYDAIGKDGLCQIRISASAEVPVKTGALSGSNAACDPYNYINNPARPVAYMPIYETVAKCSATSGFAASSDCFQVIGVAAFRLSGGIAANSPMTEASGFTTCAAEASARGWRSGTNSAKCIQGRFAQVLSVSGFAGVSSGTSFGVNNVSLID